MSTLVDLENLGYLRLLHAMLRDDQSPSDPERSHAVMLWAADKGMALRKVLTFDQRRLLGLVVEHFHKHRVAPSLEILKALVQASDKAEGMEMLLKEYAGGTSYSEYTVHDAGALYDEIASDWTRYHFASLLQKAMHITVAGVVGDPKKGEKDLRGPKDARMFLMKELQSSAFQGEVVNVGGTMKETAAHLAWNYGDNKRAAKNNTLMIPTGVPALDNTIVGMSRGTLNLILGTAGQRKSALARTFAYNAAVEGFRVLFLPLEINFKDELSIFGIIHAHNPRFFQNRLPISVENYRRGQLSPKEEEALESLVVPDLKENIGDRLIIRQLADTTWESIRSVIELENFVAPLDMVVLDYIGLLDTRHHKDKTLAINDAAVQMKQMALTFPNGRGGLVIVTPVQGSRKGYEEAKNSDGVWDKTGIYMYSELEKSADIIFFTYLPFELQVEEKVKVGTCKSRNSADAPAQTVPINLNTGYIGRDEAPAEDHPTGLRDPGLGGIYSTEG